ncbi:hypothetical protein C9I43_14325 [Shewanella morhuae]|uniref:Chromosomal replication initiator DnaA C-terminal domain-containing protein n=1 Tax=Shewanella morhuae TaxID=365591 RepID=A0ABX5HZD2_9GAMM|nr:PqqD family protein [Shewanella morhuae]PTA51582.1 hypothetical protein C9I43_14325 [Shewanella morhuae]
MDTKTRMLKQSCMKWIEQRLNETGVELNLCNLRKGIISLVSTELAKKYDLSSYELERDLEELIPEIKQTTKFTRTEVAVAQALKDCLNEKKPFQSKTGRPNNTKLSFAYLYAWACTNNLSATATRFGTDTKSVSRAVANLAKSLNIKHVWKKVEIPVPPLFNTTAKVDTIVEIEDQRDYCSAMLNIMENDSGQNKWAKECFYEYMRENDVTDPEEWIASNKKGKTNL